ncbi:xanthine dehydrogenase family protein molybdopterin-binding subunit [Aurantiacibacter xanthus]|uniref:Xanthine dehydrogenase family protein molybdopterin-binding subunit n=1 Tax=Aurantiacibacter xanthus TaxID=1784712 RepID=A0A3A1P3Z6_9SPHN|nr:molybdopterin cofactor-binding domain-containing protein [Aurantiacibacter xanthus]RIV83015.1 xanthine dehydrogenase family protein molybdopterin-binding subunit [Aurantiacibacter xanthus]
MQLTRRGILAGAALGGGLLVAWTLLPRQFDNPLAPSDNEVAFDAWVKIAADGVVTVAVPQLEMGQGVTTLLPQIVAMELGADWRQVAVEPAPVSGAYANLPLAARWVPLWRPLLPDLASQPDDFLVERFAQGNNFTATAQGFTLPAYELACREAGASARAMLAMAAADRWDVAWEECEAAGGFIRHGENVASFAELALDAARFDAPEVPPLRAQSPSEPVGDIALGDQPRTAFPRLDLPSKVDGSHVFAADVRLPDMVYAAIRHAPLDKATLAQFDPALASGQRGLIQLVRGKNWLAALGETWWAAEEALKKIAPRFSYVRTVRSETIATKLDEAVLRGKAKVFATRGNGAQGLQSNEARRYEIAPALHATLETSSATARLIDGTLELWLATQAPEAARVAAARALGISTSNVVLYPVSAGGSFDRRLDNAIAIEVALLAREAGRPVQLTWSRWQEHVASYPRMPAVGILGAQVSADGTIATLRARLASPPTMREFGCRLFDNQTSWAAIDSVAGEADPFAVEGMDPPYAIPNVAVEHVSVAIALPTAPMRGRADAITCFMRESFLDEIARTYEREPLSYRMAMLGGDARLAACLQQVARMAEWDGGAPGTGQGLACHVMSDGVAGLGEQAPATGRIAVIATASAGAGGVRVSRIAACVDIGRVVNRDLALQQIEGGLIFGLSLALGSATDYADGLPTHGRLAALGLPTLADCPEIAVEFIASDLPPFDPGEIGVAAVAPAVANAFFAATGLRLRRLPLISALA